MMGPIHLPWSEREPILAALEAIAPGDGQAEHESNDPKTLLRFFLPTPSFRRALDPNAILILGERGAGKTELFRVLGTGQGFAALSAIRPGEELRLIAGFGRVLQQQTDQPSAASVQNLIDHDDAIKWRAFWLGMLAARLLAQGESLDLPANVATALRSPARLDGWLPEVLRDFDPVLSALDGLDMRLRERAHTIVVAYDEVDRIVPSYAGLFPPLRTLLALWLDWWRRWERLRPKIILRTDLWESRLLAFPDASKLAAHRVELTWQRLWLYQMLVKRMLNQGVALANFVRDGSRRFGYPLEEQHDPLLGAIPALDEDAFAAIVAALVGEYMGANPRKGYSYWWIPNHVADARGRALPRPFLQLIALAARSARERAARSGEEIGPLLVPSDFFEGMPHASEIRLKELEEQRVWLEPIRRAFEGGTVPMDRAEVIERLGAIPWPPEDDLRAPPTTDPERLLHDYLGPMGLIEMRVDGRINVPDIYRHALDLRRKGGIARRPT
ncbi:hypothetical protein WME98_12415 [Sorangium sp. So ce296]|uniref:Uncharacterized protein n=1 Tax=Sorangium cellulosum TaxID=56 RepID=A0A150SVF1_SORCE|nr:hypothetical protein BE20_10550 [Sorangium cellulosum]KYF96268.1 hypothetical protein BE18_19680 [Sorangium cellulosum]